MFNLKLFQLCFALVLVLLSTALKADTLTLSLQDTDIRDAMLMLSKQERLNIFVAEGVDGNVSVNIYNMDTLQAIHSIAEAAVKSKNGSPLVDQDQSGTTTGLYCTLARRTGTDDVISGYLSTQGTD